MKLLTLIIFTAFINSPLSAHDLDEDVPRESIGRPRPYRDEKLKQAMADCHKETGIPKPDYKKGKRPKDEDRVKMIKCLQSKEGTQRKDLPSKSKI